MLICCKCGKTIDIALQKKVGPHLGLYCPFCGCWLKWQKQHKSSFSQLPDNIVNNLPDDIVNNLPDDIVNNLPDDIVNNLPNDIVDSIPSSFSQLPDDIVNNLPDDMPPWEV